MTRPRTVDYDESAGVYAAHRQIHGGVLHQLCSRQRGLGPNPAVLEVGCGTGNYIGALSARLSGSGCGLDPSASMLARAHGRPDCGVWVQGSAEEIPFADESFHLIFSVDVIHHVTDKPGFYRETARALRPGGWVCTVTDSADIIRRREILSGYFPETVELELARYPRMAQLEAWMAGAGLDSFQTVTVEAPYEVTSAQPFRDRAYSSLHLVSEQAWLAGLARLERDLAQGPVRGASRYACLWGRRSG